MIHYKVKARLARNLGTDDFELEEFEEVFTDQENPIEARKKAYRYYENILDILGADAYKEHTIFASLSNPLANYLEKRSNLPLELRIKLPDSYPEDLGVGLYFFTEDEDLLSHQEDYFLMGYYDFSSDAEKNLELEKRLYDLNNWDTQNWITTIKYYDFRNAAGKSEYDEDPNAIIFSEVLWTPTDFWTGSNPLAYAENDGIALEEQNQVEIPKIEESILEKIIKQGENQNLEFKSTLRYCLETNKTQGYIEYEITKTIAAFANTKGGLLLIGVDDLGNVLGLDKDIDSFRSKSLDGFLKHFDNLLKDHFNEPIDALLNYGIEEVQSKFVFKINVKESIKPRFRIKKGKNGEKIKEFFIRRAASSPSLDIEDAAQYIIDKWYAKD